MLGKHSENYQKKKKNVKNNGEITKNIQEKVAKMLIKILYI